MTAEVFSVVAVVGLLSGLLARLLIGVLLGPEA